MRRRKITPRRFLVGLGVVMIVLAISGGLLTSCSSEQGKTAEQRTEKTAEDPDARPDFKQLKRRMRADFRQIRKAVRKDRPLDMELVDRFCSDARLMTTYPDKGDEYYRAFLQGVDSLAIAAKRGDGAMLKDAVASLKEMEKECHRRLK